MRKYNTEMAAFVDEELNRDITPAWSLIEEAAFGRLLDSNPDLKLTDLLAHKDALTETPEVEVPETQKAEADK